MQSLGQVQTGIPVILRPLPLPPRFVCKNNGVLFENQLLQIGVKSEFRQNLGVSQGTVGMGGRETLGWAWGRGQRDSDGALPPPPTAGRMYLFYGNKTSVQFQNFSPTVVHPGDLQTHILSGPAQPPASRPASPGRPSSSWGSWLTQVHTSL